MTNTKKNTLGNLIPIIVLIVLIIANPNDTELARSIAAAILLEIIFIPVMMIAVGANNYKKLNSMHFAIAILYGIGAGMALLFSLSTFAFFTFRIASYLYLNREKKKSIEAFITFIFDLGVLAISIILALGISPLIYSDEGSTRNLWDFTWMFYILGLSYYIFGFFAVFLRQSLMRSLRKNKLFKDI